MENIYIPACDTVTNVKEFLSSFSVDLFPQNINTIPVSNDSLKEVINYPGSKRDFKKLLHSIDIDEHLLLPDDLPITEYDPSENVFKDMKAVNSQMIVPYESFELNTMKSLVKYYRSVNPEIAKKRQGMTNEFRFIKQVSNVEAPNDLEPFKEAVLTVCIYETFAYKPSTRHCPPQLSQEFLVYGKQFLTELRDKIFCPCQLERIFDISDNPDAQLPERSETNPGFFFISNTFYNDQRNDSNYDYSEVIRKWAQRQPDIGDLNTAQMEETRFEDLNIRLGYPQLYQHAGNCEHVITISDIRLLMPSDSLKSVDYPVLTKISSSRPQMCIVCGVCEAKYFVRNSVRLIYKTSFMCRQCFISYHYIDGKKIGEFEAYHYTGNEQISYNE